jgi:hypothetical protein
MLHTSAQERYEKLKRVFSRLMRNFNRDDLDDFIQTANSLREWIKQDESLLPEQRKHLEGFTVPESIDWQICNQIANAQKHVKRNRYFKMGRNGVVASIPTITVLEFKARAGTGFFDPQSRRIIGSGDKIILGVNGQREDALGFVIRAFRHFHYIFEIAPIPVEQRVIPAMLDIFNL